MCAGSALLVHGSSTHPVDWRLRRDAGSKGADRSLFLPGHDGLATPESSGGRRLLPVDESRSSVDYSAPGIGATMPGFGLFRARACSAALAGSLTRFARHSPAVFSERLASKENTDGAGF